MPLPGQPVTVQRSRDLRHATVTIGLPQARQTMRSAWYYANTGTELFARSASLPFAFYDVADPQVMLSALDQARSGHS
jgi:uncharacterized SAM-dependent methyltransferase